MLNWPSSLGSWVTSAAQFPAGVSLERGSYRASNIKFITLTTASSSISKAKAVLESTSAKFRDFPNHLLQVHLALKKIIQCSHMAQPPKQSKLAVEDDEFEEFDYEGQQRSCLSGLL